MDTAESEGSFRFSQVAPGAAAVAVTYSGYNTARETIVVAAGQTAVREISLYYSAMTQFDTSLNWRLTNRYSLHVEVRNLTNVPVLRYASPSNATEGLKGNWIFRGMGSGRGLSDVIIDASMPAMIRTSGQMWNAQGKGQGQKTGWYGVSQRSRRARRSRPTFSDVLVDRTVQRHAASTPVAISHPP
ncbi:MAG: hypothetical protein EXS35_19070 [Pedosphaera sp.]|nr:hypothetical protein [Pedosphaera sp.]